MVFVNGHLVGSWKLPLAVHPQKVGEVKEIEVIAGEQKKLRV